MQSSAVHADLLTEFSDCVSVVMSAHIKLEDALCNVGVALDVDLEELSLQVAFMSQVALKCLKQECGRLLNLMEFMEN